MLYQIAFNISLYLKIMKIWHCIEPSTSMNCEIASSNTVRITLLCCMYTGFNSDYMHYCEYTYWLNLLFISNLMYFKYILMCLCNQCLSPLKLWVQIPLMARCTRYNIMWSSLSVTCGRSVVFSGYSGLLHQ